MDVAEGMSRSVVEIECRRSRTGEMSGMRVSRDSLWDDQQEE